ncbi:MAG TPA: acetyl-CoA carboxylase biotin carboxylase subunit [Chloroflexota bacterium]|jgi:acetyl-CoA carboxylase biotin carboxylase subunit|nr:acetyl-CoA carboxylase biotin carboxylase subunit [Chloroflexota bacterium]
MFRRILIANRGEIALRILRACRELGVEAVVAHSQPDTDSLPVRLADDAICVGPGPAGRSYLNIPNLISAALIKECEAVHPGYGFLAESKFFAEICRRYGVTFIGPSSEVIAQMANKVEAREAMSRHGLSVLPGTHEPVGTIEVAVRAAREIGYPVMIKASGGGGGRGMHLAVDENALVQSFTNAQRESRAAFASDELYLEKFLTSCRHVEVQVLADGNRAIHLGDRDCSIQRRHQKIIEEAPSPNLAHKTRAKIGEDAVRGAEGVGFTSAGTLEFLVDDEGRHFFLEMNTRVQVEHGITEMITGVDIVKSQILIAAGEMPELDQESIKLDGHAIECRVNAESGPEFRPATGAVGALQLPGGPGIRVDTHLFAGYNLPAHYDSLVAKIMAWGRNREEAMDRMRRALDETVIEGIPTTIPYLRTVLRDSLFLTGGVHTDFVEGLNT